MLSARPHPLLQDAALRTVLAAGGSRECVEDIAASAVLGHLLALLADRPPRPDALAALAALLANTALVREALNKGWCFITVTRKFFLAGKVGKILSARGLWLWALLKKICNCIYVTESREAFPDATAIPSDNQKCKFNLKSKTRTDCQ